MAEDKNLTCRDCGKTFVFTAGEQAFFTEKGLSDPIRCPDCRRLRKQQRIATAPMPAQDSPVRSSGPRSGGAPPRTGAPDRLEDPNRGSGPSRTGDFPHKEQRDRSPKDFDDGDEERKNFRKARPAASAAKFTPPKKEQAAPTKEKRPGNRRNEEKLLLNWKEEVGLDDDPGEGSEWLTYGEDEEVEEA